MKPKVEFIKGILFFYTKYLIVYFALAFILISLFVIPYSYLTSASLLYSWEWFHREILIAYLWYFAPIFTLFIIFLILENRKVVSSKFFNLAKYPEIFHHLTFLVLFSIIIGAVSQVAGGCVWQLPVIWEGWAGYAWKRFGVEFFPDWLLIIFYSIISIAYILISGIYFEIIRNLSSHKSDKVITNISLN